ncbi:hypothetical protein TNCV_4282891 [Trichonephila clavipes]|nr:hypothetical protein TNCV_4282891 [Trichonephila clavipes]
MSSVLQPVKERSSRAHKSGSRLDVAEFDRQNQRGDIRIMAGVRHAMAKRFCSKSRKSQHRWYGARSSESGLGTFSGSIAIGSVLHKTKFAYVLISSILPRRKKSFGHSPRLANRHPDGTNITNKRGLRPQCFMAIGHLHAAYYHPSEFVGRIWQNPV